MSASSNSNSEGAEVDRLAGSARDVSQAAVNERLREFVAEVRAAEMSGERRPFAESDRLLAAMCQDALTYQEEAERKLEQARLAEAELERRALEQRGERLQ